MYSCGHGAVWLSPAIGMSVPSAAFVYVVIGGHGPSETAPAWATVSLIRTAPGGSDVTLPGCIATLPWGKAPAGIVPATTAPGGSAATGAGMTVGAAAGLTGGVA